MPVPMRGISVFLIRIQYNCGGLYALSPILLQVFVNLPPYQKENMKFLLVKEIL
jgi:hypothetical protein